jgi:hypothetical protein
VIVGDPGDAGTWAMLQAAGRRYLPFTVPKRWPAGGRKYQY